MIFILDGVYSTFTTLGGPTSVWYSHLVEENYSLYIVDNCAKETREGLERLLRLPDPIPFLAVDALLLDDYHFFNKEFRIMYGEATKAVSVFSAAPAPII